MYSPMHKAVDRPSPGAHNHPMYQEDYLLRQIRDLVQALSNLQAEDESAQHELDEALQRTLGLGLDLLDRLPAASIAGIVARGDANDGRRLCLVADALEALAQSDHPLAAVRRAKARELREVALTALGSGSDSE